MAGEFLSVYHAKLHLENDAGDDHLVLGEVTYAVPTLSRRISCQSQPELCTLHSVIAHL